MHLLGSIWITNMPMEFHPASEYLCISWALFESLTCLWNFIQRVSCCAPSRLYLNYWDVYEIPSSVWASMHFLGSIGITEMPMKFHPVCELLCTFWALCESLICLWNSIQFVSYCVPSGLYMNYWHVIIKFYIGSKLLCISWAPCGLLTCFHEMPSSL